MHQYLSFFRTPVSLRKQHFHIKRFNQYVSLYKNINRQISIKMLFLWINYQATQKLSLIAILAIYLRGYWKNKQKNIYILYGTKIGILLSCFEILRFKKPFRNIVTQNIYGTLNFIELFLFKLSVNYQCIFDSITQFAI